MRTTTILNRIDYYGEDLQPIGEMPQGKKRERILKIFISMRAVAARALRKSKPCPPSTRLPVFISVTEAWLARFETVLLNRGFSACPAASVLNK